MSRYSANGSAHAGNCLEQVEHRPVGREHLLSVARLGLLVVAGQRLQLGLLLGVVGVAGQRRDVGRGWRRPAARRSCPARPSSGAGSSIGRWVWAPLVGMIVRYCPASSPKRAITRRMRSMLLRGSTPRWSPAR